MSRDELKVIWKLRRVLSALDGQAALELLLDKLKETKSNIEFLLQVNKTTPTARARAAPTTATDLDGGVRSAGIPGAIRRRRAAMAQSCVGSGSRLAAAGDPGHLDSRRSMKTDIHPTYVETTVTCTCGNTFTTRAPRRTA